MDIKEVIMAAKQDDEIIELTQVVEENLSDGPDPEIVELLEVSPQPGGPDMSEPVVGTAFTQEQVDAALERVIEKKFAGKIEKILFEVMEKVIEKEIADIRERLQKDLDKLGNA